MNGSTTPATTNPNTHLQSIEIEDLIELATNGSANTKQQPQQPQQAILRPILANNNNTQTNSNQKIGVTSNIAKKTPQFKDSIDDIDDMLTDFENKYTSKPALPANKIPLASMATTTTTTNVTTNKQNIPLAKRGSIAANRNTPGNTRPPQPQQQQHQQQSIRDSILAQFKDDPIFSDLLQTTGGGGIPSAGKPVQQQQQQHRLTHNESPIVPGKQVNSGRRPSNMIAAANNQYISNLQRRNSIYDQANNVQNANKVVNSLFLKLENLKDMMYRIF